MAAISRPPARDISLGELAIRPITDSSAGGTTIDRRADARVTASPDQIRHRFRSPEPSTRCHTSSRIVTHRHTTVTRRSGVVSHVPGGVTSGVTIVPGRPAASDPDVLIVSRLPSPAL